MDGCFCIQYVYMYDIVCEMYVVCRRLGWIYCMLLYILYIVCEMCVYLGWILYIVHSVCVCAEDWDGYIVFSQDRTDNPAFLNIPLIER